MGIVEYMGDGSWVMVNETKSEGVHLTIIGVKFWRWLYPGSLVVYPTVPEGMGWVIRVEKDPYSNHEKKMLRIYFAQSNG